jgi:hypothetical protein
VSLTIKCDRCGGASDPGAFPGTVFLNGEDVTGWTRGTDDDARPIDLCPRCSP